jgi:glycosyltransferase involved in cell wall biosynthesis
VNGRGRRRVLGVIDHFGSGGAQRQFAELMAGLASRGHRVELFVYHPGFDFFRGRLDAEGITVHVHDRGEEGARRSLVAFRSLLRSYAPDAVVSFLEGPNLLAEVGRVGRAVPRLLVSERSNRHGDRDPVRRWVLRALHGLADGVVANSHDHAEWLERRFRWLRGKVHCVYNGVGQEFGTVASSPYPQGRLRLLAVGRVDRGKNPLVLAQACALHAARHGWSPAVTWAGRVGEGGGEEVRAAVDRFLGGEPSVAGGWRWAGESGDIPALLGEHHALVHPSLYEGLPNAVCEALATGRPAMASAVGDAARLVGGAGERGYLFAPDSAPELLRAMELLHSTSEADWEAMSARCRAYAAAELSVAGMVDRYEELITA